jgi:hypothetical protein
MTELVNTIWMCFGILAEKFKDIKKWIKVKISKKKIVPEGKSLAQVFAGTHDVPVQVRDTKPGDPILGRLKSKKKKQESSDHTLKGPLEVITLRETQDNSNMH